MEKSTKTWSQTLFNQRETFPRCFRFELKSLHMSPTLFLMAWQFGLFQFCRRSKKLREQTASFLTLTSLLHMPRLGKAPTVAEPTPLDKAQSIGTFSRKMKDVKTEGVSYFPVLFPLKGKKSWAGCHYDAWTLCSPWRDRHQKTDGPQGSCLVHGAPEGPLLTGPVLPTRVHSPHLSSLSPSFPHLSILSLPFLFSLHISLLSSKSWTETSK